jgi:hypothetical protein
MHFAATLSLSTFVATLYFAPLTATVFNAQASTLGTLHTAFYAAPLTTTMSNA